MPPNVYVHPFGLPRRGTIEEKSCQIQANANNFDASDEELHSVFFGAKQDSIRIVWEYINMMFMQLGGQEFWVRYPKDNAIFRN